MFNRVKLIESMLSFLELPGIEGKCNHFYLDSAKSGNVTVGIGHLIETWDDFLDLLPYMHPVSDENSNATKSEAEQEWKRLQDFRTEYKGSFNRHGAKTYKDGSIVVLDDNWIEEDARKLIDVRVKQMLKHFDFIKDTPFSAQMGLLDMIYNAGIGNISGTKGGHKKFFAPFRVDVINQNWLSAITHCNRPWVSGLRNQKVKEFFMRAALEVSTGIAFEEISAASNQFPATAHQTPSTKSPVHPKAKEVKNRLGLLLQNTKTNSQSRVPVPTGISAPHRKSSLPHVGLEDVVVEPGEVDKPYLQLIVSTSDKFIVTSFSGDEGLSELFCYHIVAYSKNHNIVGNDLLSKSVTLQVNDKHKIRYFNGDVYAFSAGEFQAEFRQYTLELRPRLWFLSHASNSRIFHNLSTKEIVKKICEEFRVSVDVSRLYHPLKPRSYCVQYNETTLNFIQRLLEEEGIFYFFRHEKDKHTLVLADDWVVYKSMTSAKSVELEDCHHNYKACVSKFTQMDYHYGAPSNKLDVSHLANKILLDKKYEYRQSFDGYKDQNVGEVLARKRLDAEQIDQEWIAAHSKNSELQPAYKFQIKDDSYVVVRMQHYAAERHHVKRKNKQAVRYYSNQIICIPANKTYRPPRITPKPQICGVMPAKVVGTGERGQEVGVDQYGSVLVHFLWDREKKSSCRVRVAQSAAGNKHGLVFHPRIGDELMVIFEEGDPDRPLIQGNQHNAESMPIYELPSDHTKSGIKTKTVNGSGQNEIRFEDESGAEEIYIHAQKDHLRIVEESEKITINKGDQTVKISSGKSVCEAANAIEFKVASSSVLINQDGIFINGQEVKINN